MSVRLTRSDLTREQVVRVARDGEAVRLAEVAIERMLTSRAVVEQAHSEGRPVYGLSTAVGVLKRVAVKGRASADFSHRLIRHHLVSQGPTAPTELVRATMLRLANGFAHGTAGVRPRLAERLVAALNSREHPRVRILGSVGQADLAPMADLSDGLFGGMELEAGEGLALVGSNAFSTAWAALAVSDAARLLDWPAGCGARARSDPVRRCHLAGRANDRGGRMTGRRRRICRPGWSWGLGHSRGPARSAKIAA